MRLSHSSITDVGRIRSNNEDSYFANSSIGLYIVADGMGGHAGGAYASRSCVDIVSRTLQRELKRENSVESAFSLAVAEANTRIFDISRRDSSLHGMGTTVTGLLFRQGLAHIRHVGDSRCYQIRSGHARQLTEDHSLVNEQIKSGYLTEEEAKISDLKHIITRSIGFKREIDIDSITVNVNHGDIFILCSDGLSNHVSIAEIASIADRYRYSNLPKKLCDIALNRGGEDNVTVVAIKVQ